MADNDAIMAEQEALAKAKYGNLATRGRAGSIGKASSRAQLRTLHESLLTLEIV